MRVLAMNAGSSSLKAALLDARDGRRLASVHERVVADHAAAAERALAALGSQAGAALAGLEAVGHRIVHGGAGLLQPVCVDDAVEARIAACVPLAPLHNPAGLAVLRAVRSRFPGVPQVAVFDTAFHAAMPEAARRYALPEELVARLGLRRYGFHGINHAQVMRRVSETLGIGIGALRLVSCHLGAGGSVAAIDGGRSVDTSMGWTPLEGLVMGTRAGDLDPGVVLQLARDALASTPADPLASLEALLNRRSGLLALAGTADMAAVERGARAGEPRAGLALEVYVQRLRRYLGAMCASLGGADAIAFSGGIGEHASLVRARACSGLGWMRAQLDAEANESAAVSHAAPVARISTPSSAVRLLVVAADEERAIAEEVDALLSGRSGAEAAS
jgi:acetate kinase